MGLLDPFLGGLTPQDQMNLAAGLLGGQGNIGANLQQGVLGMQAQQQKRQAEERLNRANDLQQVTGVYNLLKQQEFARMLSAKQSGQPYTPNPMLPQLEQKIGELSGLPNTSGGASATYAAATQRPTLPAPQASQYSSVVKPEFQAQGPMPQPQAAMDNLGKPAGGVPMEAWLAQDPSGKSYLGQLAKDNMERMKPIANRGYGVGFTDLDAQGRAVYRASPESVDQAIEMERRKLQTSEPYQTVPATNAAGATVPTFKYQLPGYPAAQQGPGAAPPAISQPPQRNAPALQSPQRPANDPFADIPLRYKPQGMGQTTFDKSADEHNAALAMELKKQHGEQAVAANSRIALNNQALSLVDQADTGPMAAQIGDVKNWLVSRVGIPESSFANTPSATAALQKDLMNAATQRAKQQFGSRITQSEVMLMLSRGAPNVDMTKAAIKYLVQTDNAASQYAIDQANYLNGYLGRGGDPGSFEAFYARKFPQTNTISQVHLNTGQQEAPATAPTGWSIKRIQ